MELTAVYTIAAAHIAIYAIQMQNACDTFKNFAETKVENMEADTLNKSVIKAAMNLVISGIMDFLPAGDTLNKLGKFVYAQIKDGLKKSLEEATKLPAGELNEKTLKKYITNLSEVGNSVVINIVGKSKGNPKGLAKLKEEINFVQACLQANTPKRLTKEEHVLLEHFYDSTLGEKEALLDHFYAIPKPEATNQLARNLYNSLVDKFSKIYGWAASSDQGRSLHRKAQGWFGGSEPITKSNKFKVEAGRYWEKDSSNRDGKIRSQIRQNGL
ncbi:MAG: hypothetical protein V2J55_05470 [Candidatus Competibacteraceae bacterium]|nr:hypothetical protein [Candidatus Competibacteraceae bacterium]